MVATPQANFWTEHQYGVSEMEIGTTKYLPLPPT